MTHKLGMRGYKEFKQELLKEIESSKYTKQSVDFTTPFYSSESSYDVIKNMGTLYKESIDVMNSYINIKDIDNIVDTIIHSKRLFIFAIGDTKLTIKSFINKLIKENIYVISATDYHEEISSSLNITEKDVVLFVSYSLKSSAFQQCFPIIKQSGCKIITLTANDKHTITKYSHYHILIPDKEKDHKIATFYSQLCFQYLLNIIYALIHNKIHS